jgi:hypothetical protein
MAVKKIWHITHTCGHESDRDLSTRPADRRAGFAEWLARQECTDCWRTTRDADRPDTATWLATKRAEEQAAAEAWSTQYRMPPLDGTDRAVPWAVRCRHQILTAAYTTLVTENGTSDTEWEALEDAARTITRAGWWIDQRDSNPEDLPELLQAATDTDRPTENPHY